MAHDPKIVIMLTSLKFPMANGHDGQQYGQPNSQQHGQRLSNN
jgi:hypothetical protein